MAVPDRGAGVGDSDAFVRYLEAKRTVDERARNRQVLDRLHDELRRASLPYRVLDIGAGTGAMIEEAVSWEVLPKQVEYTAVEVDPKLVDTARGKLLDRADATEGRDIDTVLVETTEGEVAIEFITADAFEFLASSEDRWDLIVAQAFFDLTDVSKALERMLSGLVPEGLLYAPLTFDGETRFEPSMDLDERIVRRYHRHMDETVKAGGFTGESRAGRRLLGALSNAGSQLLSAGASDWIIRPVSGDYPADEAYVLFHLLETIRNALGNDPGFSDDFTAWLDRRHRQLEEERLSFFAHQLDILGRRS